MFEVSGTHFEKGVFEIYLEKPAPKLLRWIFRLGPIPARLIGLGLLSFSFLFTLSHAPARFILEQNWADSPQGALTIQQNIGMGFFYLAALFYMTVFLFRKETMVLIFNKASKLFSVERAPFFRFTSLLRGHVPFEDLKPVEKIAPDQAPPHGKIVLRSEKLPDRLKQIEFKVLTDEQFEYFPLNIERILG